jgi:single-stranded DNA-binding protein
MAAISIAGTVTGRSGEPPVTLKTFQGKDGTQTVASFSVADLEYIFTKKDEERQGQFYNCEVRGKSAELCAERIQRGDKIAVTGQLVQRMYNEKMYITIKNASVTYLEKRKDVGEAEMPF